MQNHPKEAILPFSVKKIVILLWVFILPQTMLLVMNVFSFWIVREDISAANMYKVFVLAGCELFFVVMFCVLWSAWKRKGREVIPWKWNVCFLPMHMAYLWYATYEISLIIPPGTESWILDRGQVILQQYTFMMPALFYAALRLACFETRLKRGSDVGRSLLAAVAAPMLWYTAMLGLSTFYQWSWRWFPTVIGIVFFVGSSVITLVALIRLMVLIYSWYKDRDAWTHNTVIALVALIGPLAGLLLNYRIPFPADFQTEMVYVLAVVNGLILLLPAIFNIKHQRVQLFLRALAYPFTVYFFLVFLPFLPLSLLAICAMGLGFLFLIPVVLFLLHTIKLIEDYQTCARQDNRIVALTLVCLAVIVLPGLFVAETCHDKTAIQQALDYVYSADYTQPQRFSGSSKAVERTLVKMRQAKDGAQLPYLSVLYNRIVFHGMVLPDSKMEYMYQLFTGKQLNDVAVKSNIFRDRIRGRAGRRRAAREVRPERDRNVILYSITTSSRDEGFSTVTKVRFQIINLGKDNAAEFFRECTLPPGVLITDFRLSVNKEMVQGQIFEKKTATWVYHMIRDWTQRDPGLLIYKSPVRFDFSIFPLRRRETRYAEIEFTYPRDADPVIYIGQKDVALRPWEEGPGRDPLPLLGQDASGEDYVLAFPQMLEAAFHVKRKPYLHFILNFSNGEKVLLPQYVQQITDAAAQFPDIQQGKISAANFEIEDLTLHPIDLKDKDTVAEQVQNAKLPSRGALDLTRVFKHEMMLYQNRLSSENLPTWQGYPVFVVLTQKEENILFPEDMMYYQSLTPENDSYYLKILDQPMQKRPLFDVFTPVLPEDVVVFKRGKHVSFAPGAGEQWRLVMNLGREKQKVLEVYNPYEKRFVPIMHEKIPEETYYAKALGLYIKNYRDYLNPYELEQSLVSLVQQSKTLTVMIPSTSNIIVERSSQWNILKLKEFQRLHSDQGLEFEEDFETPAPPLWMLTLAGFLWLWMRHHGKKQRRCVRSAGRSLFFHHE